MRGLKVVARALFISLFVVVAGVLPGCRPAGSATDGRQTPTGIAASSVTATPVETATTQPRAPGFGGTVMGQFVDVNTQEPLAGLSVFLARIEGTEDFPVAALNRNEDPGVETTPDGSFEFVSVKGGKYVIIVGSEGTGGMIQDTITGHTLVVDVGDGQVANVGRITIERP